MSSRCPRVIKLYIADGTSVFVWLRTSSSRWLEGFDFWPNAKNSLLQAQNLAVLLEETKVDEFGHQIDSLTADISLLTVTRDDKLLEKSDVIESQNEMVPCCNR